MDSRAVVSSTAKIGNGRKIGAYAVVGDEVELGEGCILDHHAVVHGPARLGPRKSRVSVRVGGRRSAGPDVQRRARHSEVGDHNEFREFSTVNRGTVKGGGVTRVGSHNLIMSYAHIAHDCQIGDHTIFCQWRDAGRTCRPWKTTRKIGAFCPVHQFCRIGKHSYIAAHTVITQDVPPFSKMVAPRGTRCFGVNAVGLERQGFSSERIKAIEKAYRLLLRSKLNTSQALEKMRGTLAGSRGRLNLMRFIESAPRARADQIA